MTMDAVEWEGAVFAGSIAGAWPIHVVRLNEIGLDADAFLSGVRPSFDRTAWDLYDVANRRCAYLRSLAGGIEPRELEEIEALPDAGSRVAKIDELVHGLPEKDREQIARFRPHRRRAMRKYRVERAGPARWRLEPSGDTAFTQSVSDFRARTRHFQLVEAEVAYHPGILGLIASAAETARWYRPGTERLEIVLHQMTTVARPAQAGHPAPEGVHQDGADFIVSALVVERHGIRGALSRVREGRDGPPVLEIELATGEGIFQADSGSPLWHEVTPVSVVEGAEEGHRMVLGLDINCTGR